MFDFLYYTININYLIVDHGRRPVRPACTNIKTPSSIHCTPSTCFCAGHHSTAVSTPPDVDLHPLSGVCNIIGSLNIHEFFKK